MAEAMTYPRILNRKNTVLSPWLTLLEKEVQFHPDAAPEVYHSVTQSDYVAVFAVTAVGRIPLVRQYRPAVEAFTWEFPAGTVDPGETPATAAERELREETGLRAERLDPIGDYFPDTGRLSLLSSGYFARCAEAAPVESPEVAIELRYVTLEELFEMVKTGEFRHQMHIALIGSALVRGHVRLPDRGIIGDP